MKRKIYAILSLAFLLGFTSDLLAQNVTVAGSAGAANGSYATLKAAFDALNLETTQAGNSITVTVVNSTTETAAPILNQPSVSSWTALTIQPGASPVTVSGNITGAIIKLNGADNVTIDGRISGSGRNLTISNTSTAAATAGVWIASAGVGLGATGNTIRNCNIACGVTSNTSTSANFGIAICGTALSTTSAGGDDNDNNSIIDNSIIRARYGILVRGVSATNLDQNISITNNVIGPAAFGADQIGKVGIFCQFSNLVTISQNEIRNVGLLVGQTSTSGADRIGIAIGSESWSVTGSTAQVNTNYTVTQNLIHDIIEEQTFSALGILSACVNTTSPTNIVICSNMIYNVRSNGTSGDQSEGIGYSAGHSDQVVYNSIYMSGDVDPGTATASTTWHGGIRIATASSTAHANLTLKNNIVYMDMSSSSTAALRFYAISGNGAAYSFGTGGEDNNDFYINPSNPQSQTGALGTGTGNAATTSFATLAAWKLAYTVNQDANSIQANPGFISSTDLHISTGSTTVNNVGTTTGVTCSIDYDGQSRSGTPDIGADEYTPLTCSAANGGTISPSTASKCIGQTYTMTAAGAEAGVGITYSWEISSTGGGVGFSPVSGGTGAATTSYTTAALTPGIYYYRLNVTCSFGPVTGYSNELTLTVNSLPTVSVTPNPANAIICGTGSVTLTANGATTYAWSPTAGLTPSSGSPVSASPSSTTVYTVTGTDGNGCTNTASQTVSVGPAITVSSVTATPSSVCSGGNSQLNAIASANPAANYTVASIPVVAEVPEGGSTVLCSGGTSSPAVQGTFGLDDGYWDGIALPFNFTFYGNSYNTVRIGTNGNAQFGPVVNPGRNPGNGSYTPQTIPTLGGYLDNFIAGPWMDQDASTTPFGTIRYFTNGVSPNQKFVISFEAVHVFNSSDNNTSQIIIHENGNIDVLLLGGGLVATTLKAIGLENSTGSLGIAAPGRNAVSWTTAADEAWRFTPPSLNYSWSPSTYLDDPSIATPIASGITGNITYTVTATGSLGCTGTGTVTILSGAPLSCSPASIGGPACENTNFTVTANTAGGGPPFNYVWSDGIGGSYANSQTITANLPAGNYTFTASITDACGGSCTSSVNVTVSPLPGGSASGPATGITYSSLQYVVSGYAPGSTFQWQSATAIGGPYSNISGVTNDTADLQAASAGTFYIQVVVTGPSGCTSIAGPIQTVVTVGGDNVCEALPLSVGLNGPYTNVGATTEAGEEGPGGSSCTGQLGWCSGQVPSNSVWFTFVAPPSGRISLHFSPGNWDSELALYSAASCTDALASATRTFLAANDDSSGSSPYNAYIAPICLTPGQTYFVQVDGYSTTTNSSFRLLLVEEPSLIAVTAAPSAPIQCFGYTTCVDVSATGGSGNYGGTVGNFCGYGAGDYTFTVTDDQGCVGTSSNVHLSEPDKIEGTTTPTSATCGLSNGSITVTPTGGSGTYTGYSWNSTPVQNTQTATGLPAGNYIVTITDNNGCTGTASGTVGNVGSSPAQPSAITGPSAACKGQSGVLFSVANVAGVTYNWSLPAGASGSSSTNSIVVNFSMAYAGGLICVSATNACGTSTQSCLPVAVITGRPAFPAAPSGPTISVCGPTTVSYSIPPSANATFYQWTVVGTGLSIASGQGTTSIIVNVAAGFSSGQVRVYAGSCSGISGENSVQVYGLITSQPQQAIFPSIGVCGGNTYTYAVTPFNGATGITWTAPAGSLINGISNPLTTAGNVFSVNITFPLGFISGNVSVFGSNGCGNGLTRTVLVRSVPAQPAFISGPTSVTCGQSGVTYSTTGSPGATSYTWTLPAGVTGSSTTNSITVNFTGGFSGLGSICVIPVNACGNGPQRCLSVSCSGPVAPSQNMDAARVAGVSSSINAYPNPTSGKLNVSFTTLTKEKYTLKVTDLIGKVMISQPGVAQEGVNLQEIDLGSVAKGMYLLSIEREGTETQTMRIVVE